MVMAHWGFDTDEATLRLYCKTDLLGTSAKDAVACAKHFGFDAIEVRGASFSNLGEWLTKGFYPILLLNLFPLDALWVSHAVVLEHVSDERVVYLDPAQGRRTANLIAFEQAWQMGKNRAILVASLHNKAQLP